MYVHGQVIMNLLDACNAEKERCLSILFTLPRSSCTRSCIHAAVCTFRTLAVFVPEIDLGGVGKTNFQIFNFLICEKILKRETQM